MATSNDTSDVPHATYIHVNENEHVNQFNNRDVEKKNDEIKQIETNEIASLCQWPSSLIEKVIVIWVDPDLKEFCTEYQKGVNRLRYIVHSMKIFTDIEFFMDFIEQIESARVILILASTIEETVIPLVHNITEIDSIYVSSHDIKLNSEWSDQWTKLKGTFADISSICDHLETNIKHNAPNCITTNLNSAHTSVEPNELDQSFMYSQLLKEILLNMNEEAEEMHESLERCRTVYASDKAELKRLISFEKSYETKSPLFWYKRAPSLYRLMNRALKKQDIENIIKMRFLIKDLLQEIENLYTTANRTEKIIVYRGQVMPKSELNHIIKNRGHLIFNNNFLSATLDSQVALMYSHGAPDNANVLGVIFQIEIDPKVPTTPFAILQKIDGLLGFEDELLFSMHSVFRICDVEEMTDGLWNVKLTATSDTDQELEQLRKRIQEEIEEPDNLHKLGNLLMKMGEYKQAEEYFNKLLKCTSQENAEQIASVYDQLGCIAKERADFSLALSHHEKALEIYQKIFQQVHPKLALVYSNIGRVYFLQGDYSTALSYYEKTLEINKQSPSSENIDLAAIYNNIGEVYYAKGEYPIALRYHEKTLEVKQKVLPSNHPDLATSFNNIGRVHESIGNYSVALSYYEKTLEIQQKTLPPNHPLLASTYNNMGEVYLLAGNYPSAFSYFDKTLMIQEKILQSNHPTIAKTYNNMGEVLHCLGEYCESLSYFEKTLGIQQKSLSPYHPELATTYKNIAMVSYSMGDYASALSNLEHAHSIQQKCLPPNHPLLATTYNKIGMVYYSMGDYEKSLRFYEKTLEIQREALPLAHPDLAMSYNNIGRVQKCMGNYAAALSYYEKTLEIQRKTLPPSHPDLAITYTNIGKVNRLMGKYSPAISFFKKTLKIQQLALPSNHPMLAITYRNLGQGHACMEHYSEALSYYEKAVKIQQKVLLECHPLLATTYNDIGTMYQSIGNCSSALMYYEKTLKIQLSSLPSNHIDLAQTYSNLGETYRLMGNYSVALIHLQKALSIQCKILPAEHQSIATSYYRMSLVLQNLDQYGQAVEYATRALDIARHSEIPNKSEVQKLQENLDNMLLVPNSNDETQKEKTQEWALPVQLVYFSSFSPRLHSIFNELDDNHSVYPIAADKCVTALTSNMEIRSIVFEITALPSNERDHFLEEYSKIDHVRSIYLLGKISETNEERKKLLARFQKVCMICEDAETLALRWILDTANECRLLGAQCISDKKCDLARKYFACGKKLISRLKKFVDKRTNAE